MDTISVGDIITNNKGVDCLVVEYVNFKKVKVRFMDEVGFEKYVTEHALRNGFVKNPYYKSVFGVGFLGDGKFKSTNKGVKNKYYVIWYCMMERCYSKGFQARCPTYKGCTVCVEWHNFQVFAEWCIKNKFYDKGYHLDKDLKVKGNKVYSPETCCFVPQEVNCLFLESTANRGDYPIGVSLEKSSGLFSAQVSWDKGRWLGRFSTVEEAKEKYDEAKESRRKYVAEKWRGNIDEDVYVAILSREMP